jgi:hypothetical protein
MKFCKRNEISILHKDNNIKVYVVDINFEVVGMPHVLEFCYQFKVILCEVFDCGT